MDIYCPRCTEPWDNDCLHDAAEEFGSTYEKIKQAFITNGCSAIVRGPDHAPSCAVVHNDRSALINAAMDLSPHADDWAADLDGWL